MGVIVVTTAAIRECFVLLKSQERGGMYLCMYHDNYSALIAVYYYTNGLSLKLDTHHMFLLAVEDIIIL